MFVMPALIAMSITATRLYTSLTDFSSSADMYDDRSPDVFHPTYQGRYFNSVAGSDPERGRPAISNHLNVMQKPVVHVAHEQCLPPQSTFLSLDFGGQSRDKPQGLSIDETLEIGVGI
jgi:hypothetical protein